MRGPKLKKTTATFQKMDDEGCSAAVAAFALAGDPLGTGVGRHDELAQGDDLSVAYSCMHRFMGVPEDTEMLGVAEDERG